MGRKAIELTAKQIQEVKKLGAYLSLEQIGDYFGISAPTFIRLRKENATIDLNYKAGKSKAIKSVAKGLLQKALEGDTSSMIFYLKTQAGWRETNRTELTGPDGEPIQTINTQIVKIDFSDKTIKELAAIQKALGLLKDATKSDIA